MVGGTLLASGTYDNKERSAFIRKGMKGVFPMLLGMEVSNPKENQGLSIEYEIFMSHRFAFIKGYRKLARHILAHNKGLFRKIPSVGYEVYDLNEDNLSIAKKEGEQYHLHVLLPKVKIEFETAGWLFKRPKKPDFGIWYEFIDCVGNKDEVVDFCLLQWKKNLKNASYDKVWQQILTALTGKKPVLKYDQWLGERLEQSGQLTEKQWILALMRSDSPDLAIEAIYRALKIAPGSVKKVIPRIITDINIRSDVRTVAITTLLKKARKEGLIALIEVLDDKQLCWRREYEHVLNDSYPFSDRDIICLVKKHLEKNYKNERKSENIGVMALSKLQGVTKQDFGMDKQAWRVWITANIK